MGKEVCVHVSHRLCGSQRSPPYVPSSPSSTTCNYRRLQSPHKRHQKLGFERSQVRPEAALFLLEAGDHRIRDGLITYEDYLHLRLKMHTGMRNNPHFLPFFSAPPRSARQLEMLWTSQGEHAEPVNALRTPLLTPSFDSRSSAVDLRTDSSKRSGSSGP